MTSASYFAAFTLTLWAFAHGGSTKPAVASYDETELRLAASESRQLEATVGGGGPDGRRSADLRYVTAIQSSGVWAAVKRRSLTVSTADARTADIVNAAPDSLSDGDLAALRRACHDGLKCVAVDQLLVLRSTAAAAAAATTVAPETGGFGRAALARRAITKITRVLTRYTDEYHEASTYVEVAESDGPSAVSRSVTVILEDNKELCGPAPRDRRAPEPAVSKASGSKASGSKTPDSKTIDSKTPDSKTSDSKTSGKGPQKPAIVNNGTVNYGTINNININNGTVNSAKVTGQTPPDYVAVGPDAAGGSDRAPPAGAGRKQARPARARAPRTGRADDGAESVGPAGAKRPAAADRRENNDGVDATPPASGAGESCSRRLAAGDDADVGIANVGTGNGNAVSDGYVEDGVVNNGRMAMRDENEGVRNKGIVNRTGAKDGIVNVGTLNNGPTRYVAANRAAGDRGTDDEYAEQYAADVDAMYSSVIKQLAAE